MIEFFNVLINSPWLIAAGILFLFILLLFFFSFFRNARNLWWFYGAGILVAALYVFTIVWFPRLLESFVSYRSDWSLVFLVQNISISRVLSQLVFYFFLYVLLGLALILLLQLWSLITFRWQRMKTIFSRSFSESWFVLLFTVFSTLMGLIWFALFNEIDFETLTVFFQLSSFLFLLQFFLRLTDNAYLHTPKLYIEFVYASGLAFLAASFLVEWVTFTDQAFTAKTFFLQQFFAFFLVILLLGFIATFFVRALFASTFFLEHYHRQSSVLISWTSRFFLSARDRHYAHYRVLLGLLLSLLLGYLYVIAVLQEWYLTLIPAFFLGYFILFYLLDRQDDMRVKGDLVDKRIEAEVRKIFFS